MMMNCIVVFFLSVFSIAFAADPCRFEYSGKGVIDLTSVGHSDGTAAFVNQTTPSSPHYIYSYNPCKPFAGPSICENVAACQVTVGTGVPYNLGTQESAVWSPGSDSGEDPSVTYSAGERKTIVRLLCSTSGETHFEVIGEGPVSVYLFRLTHKCACWNGCGSPSSSTTTGLPTTTPIVETCRFTDPDYGVIDLTTLGHTDGTPAYLDKIPSTPDGFKYSYNPCKSFSEGPVCQNAAACLFSVEGTDAAIIGVQNTVQYLTPGTASNYPVVAYKYGEDHTAYVELVCSTTDENQFDLLGRSEFTFFLFRLTNKCACWNACSSTPASTTTLVPITTTSQSVTDECRYVHPEKGIIDFSFIGRTDEKAAYSDETTRTVSNFKYSYNPCRSFSQGSGCIGAAVCQVSNDGQETFTLGTQESHWWVIPSDGNALPSLNYMYADKKVSVLLQCSTEGNNEFQAFGEDPVNTFKFQLTHQCACWNGC